MQQLKGYRTYIIAGLLALCAGLYALGVIDKETFEALMGALTGGGLATLRLAINNK